MLTEICAELKNYFIRGEKSIHAGKYTISDGSIEPLSFLKDGQYFRIVGSDLNDGVHRYPASDLNDEVFEGAVWAMAVPPAVIALAAEIETWIANNQDAINSPYSSESFGGYSYSKRASSREDDTGTVTWQSQFANRLNPYRRLFVL